MKLYVRKIGMTTKGEWGRVWSKREYATYGLDADTSIDDIIQTAWSWYKKSIIQ